MPDAVATPRQGRARGPAGRARAGIRPLGPAMRSLAAGRARSGLNAAIRSGRDASRYILARPRVPDYPRARSPTVMEKDL
jgi:hypothetical protein